MLRLRMGAGQRLWVDFLDWCRSYDSDVLTWRERRARWLWCPRLGHDIGKRWKDDDAYYADCRNCRGELIGSSEEQLEENARRGILPWQPLIEREREDLVKK